MSRVRCRWRLFSVLNHLVSVFVSIQPWNAVWIYLFFHVLHVPFFSPNTTKHVRCNAHRLP